MIQRPFHRRRPATAAFATAIAALLALLLAACTGLPTGGAVVAGEELGEEANAPDFSYLPDPPPPGASPEQIVAGFLAAGSGPRDDWLTARRFLTPDFQQTWQPLARTIVEVPGERMVSSVGDDTVSVGITPEASVDESGALTMSDGATVPLEFRLEQVDGEWRIAEAPNGIVLDRARFQAVFREYSVMYFDPTWTFLVPDRRWFPATNAATHIAQALIDGEPTPWLAGSVLSAFPDSLELATRAVPLEAGIAQVPLTRAALAVEPDTRDRMQTQLEASLQSAGIGDAQLLIDGEPVEAEPVAVRSTRVDVRPLVLTGDAFGFLSGSAIESIPGLSDTLVELQPTSVQVDADRVSAAVRTPSGAALRVRDDGTFEAVDERAGLIDPTIDPFGYIWTVPEGSPTGMTATSVDGETLPWPDAWPGASQITALDVSRDGTRLAALVRDGTRPALWVAGILRDADGTPVGIGEREIVDALPGTGSDIGWVDGGTVLLLADDGESEVVVLQSIGGFGDEATAPAETVDADAAHPLSATRVLDADGVLYAQRGPSWSQLAADVLVLATQRGMPR